MGDEKISIRKIAKKLRISKTTVEKYVKLFEQGYDPYAVNTKSLKKKTSFSNNQISSEKILLNEKSKEITSESNIIKDSAKSIEGQTRKPEEDHTNLKQELTVEKEEKNTNLEEKLIEEIELKNNLLQVLDDKDDKITILEDEKTNLNEELKVKDEEKQKLNQVTQEQKTEIFNLKKERYQYQEQLKSKDEEIKNQKQLLQKTNDDNKYMYLLGKIDAYNQYYAELSQQLKKLNNILDQSKNNKDKNELYNLIQKKVSSQYNKAFPSTDIETTQKESNITISEETQNFEKKYSPNLELKKSNDYRFATFEYKCQVGALSLIEAGKRTGWYKINNK